MAVIEDELGFAADEDDHSYEGEEEVEEEEDGDRDLRRLARALVAEVASDGHGYAELNRILGFVSEECTALQAQLPLD